ncbi:histidinol-phosphate transaminase [Isoalcanivorax indicus]|uniref:histidinol-phosphate transaminase n=1 Tax=Isoalcanivorax indicus TaxID=2202653 RepID=UPI000DBA51B3|nr:histidinol-phosphate transaminase [Isoalcanivorax indicus]
MSRYWSRFVHDLEPYVPGEQPKMARLVKLNTNENPFGPSPKALAAIAAASGDDLRLYPDPDASALKAAIARRYAVQADQVFVGNGSDEVLAHLFMGFFRQDKPILFPDITYSFYKVYCGLYGIDYRTPPLDDDFGIRLADYPPDNGGIIFPNPNAPTGRLLPLADIEALLQRNTASLVVVDEAYVDFGGESAVALVSRYPNLLVTQTFSKSRSLAGLRIGFAVGQAPLIDGLERIKNSFNSYPLDRLAIVAGVAAMDDEAWFSECVDAIVAEREALTAALAARGFEVLPSAANFVFARHPGHAGEALAAGLREHGVIVRHFQRPERISPFLRITIGTPEQNQALLSALDSLL